MKAVDQEETSIALVFEIVEYGENKTLQIFSDDFQVVQETHNTLVNVTLNNLKPDTIYPTQVFIADNEEKSDALEIILRTTSRKTEGIITNQDGNSIKCNNFR